MNRSNKFEKRGGGEINIRKVHITLTIKSSPNFERKNQYIYQKLHIPLINVKDFSNVKKQPM
jgi:DnaJ-class molecular chaperone